MLIALIVICAVIMIITITIIIIIIIIIIINVFKCNLKELTTKSANSTRGQRSV